MIKLRIVEKYSLCIRNEALFKKVAPGLSERTNASTTQMLRVADGRWDAELFKRLGLPLALMPEVVGLNPLQGYWCPACVGSQLNMNFSWQVSEGLNHRSLKRLYPRLASEKAP